MTRYKGALTDVPGLTVGHATDDVGLTGCTVVLCGEGAVAGGSVRGFAPGTRETALLRPGMLVERVHGVLLSGGSAFGLAAADGVMRYLEEEGIGFDAGVARVPIVPAAVLFDLAVGDATVRPDAQMGYDACRSAVREDPRQGNVGAGMGATVGKLGGIAGAMKGGLGMASLRHSGVVVAALVCVNALGNVVDPDSASVLAGSRRLDGPGFVCMPDLAGTTISAAAGNTVIGVVATNANLDVAEANRLAAVAHDGLARVIRPSHTLYDGDTLFSLAMGHVRAEPLLLMAMAVEVVARAIVNAVLAAESVDGIPSVETKNSEGWRRRCPK